MGQSLLLIMILLQSVWVDFPSVITASMKFVCKAADVMRDPSSIPGESHLRNQQVYLPR